MEDNRFLFTAGILLLVVIVALVAGVNFSIYSNDLNKVVTDENTSITKPLSQLNQTLLEFELLGQDAINEGYDAVEMRAKVAQSLDKLQPDIDLIIGAEPQDPDQLILVLNEIQDFEGDARAALLAKPVSLEVMLGTMENFHVDIEKLNGELQVQIDKENLRDANLIRDLRASTKRSLLVSFISVVIALIGMVYFARLSSRNEELATRNQELIHRANALSDAKSRLLTMLSHEIRTPLNGIIVLSDLTLQSELTEDQKSMLDAIHKSSLDLSNVVAEMLDFTDFSTMSIDSNRQYILRCRFMDNLYKALLPVAEQYDKKFSIKVENNTADVFISDYARLFRGFYFLFSYLLEKSPDQKLVAEFSIDKGSLILKSDFNYLYEFDSDWRLEHIGVSVKDDPNRITLDGIESSMARGLLESLGGNIRVLHNEKNANQHRLLIDVPVERAVPIPIHIHKIPEGLDLPNEIVADLNKIPHKYVNTPEDAHLIFANFGDDVQAQMKKLIEIVPMATVIGVNVQFDHDIYHYNVGLERNVHAI